MTCARRYIDEPNQATIRRVKIKKRTERNINMNLFSTYFKNLAVNIYIHMTSSRKTKMNSRMGEFRFSNYCWNKKKEL